FIDTSIFHPGRRSEEKRLHYGLPGEFLVGHLSNFRRVKRIHDVVRTFHLIHRQIPARLLMMGTGACLEGARGLSAELGIQDHVRFLGAVHRVEEVLPQLDIFLLPSEYESFGLAALEAMACGVPVISTRTGGVPELIEHGVSGFLCEVGDYRCMADVAVRLLRDTRTFEELRRTVRRRAVEVFPLEQAVGRYEEYYAEIMGSPRE
ncbi:MAG: glycosyltransferase, partial [Planctomycetes bacterium]|nr:glycosyltransferase [Planctomycetota bacterium]